MSKLEYLTVAEALKAVLNGVNVLSVEHVPLLDALGRVLGESVSAADSLPPFANSAMDGYAFQAADVQTASPDTPVMLKVVGDIAAGTSLDSMLLPGQAARIMTGAPLPEGADAVIPVEDTNEPWRQAERPLPDQIQIFRSVQPGDYVRQVGEDVVAGQQLLQAGHILRPQEVGALASMGISQIPVIRQPKVGILATGDELLPVTEPLRPGKIRNSNGYTQAAQVLAAGAIPVSLGIAQDTDVDVRAKLQAGLDAGVDLFVSSAGVSVGAYDVVKSVLEQGGDAVFWRVRMRPGKPLAFGTYQGVPYLGLPGNPVSAMVSFERFARAAILKMAGFKQLDRPRISVIVNEEIHSDGRESYLRAVVSREKDGGYTAVTTGGQGSHMMTSLVRANALLIVPEGITHAAIGETLSAWMVNWPETIF